MITAIDTNILLDVFGADRRFGADSSEALRSCMNAGAIVACEVVWAETATAFPLVSAFRRAMHALSISFSALSEEAGLQAADVWRRYRAEGGRRDRIASDFLIGAHALTTADRLLTRDRGFYRKYFGGLRVLDPSVQH